MLPTIKKLIFRPTRAALYSNGATANRRVEWTPGAPGNVAGLPMHGHMLLYVPTSNPASTVWLACWSSNNLPSGGIGVAQSLFLVLTTSGELVLRQTGTTNADQRNLTNATFRSTYSGRLVLFAWDFLAGDSTTNPVLSGDGVDITSSFTLTTAGSAVPNWLPPTLVPTYFVCGGNWPAGVFEPAQYGPGAWTQAENLTFAQTGKAPIWWIAFTGSAVAVYSKDFSTSSGWALGGSASIASGVLTLAAASDYAFASAIFPRLIGTKIRVRFDYATTLAGNLTLYGYNHTPTWLSNNQTFALTGNGTYEADFTVDLYNGAACGIEFVVPGTGGWFGTIDNLAIYQLGGVIKPVIQPNWIADSGTNAIVGTLISGVRTVRIPL